VESLKDLKEFEAKFSVANRNKKKDLYFFLFLVSHNPQVLSQGFFCLLKSSLRKKNSHD